MGEPEVGESDETLPAGEPNRSGGVRRGAFRPKPGEPTDVFRHRGAEQERGCPMRRFPPENRGIRCDAFRPKYQTEVPKPGASVFLSESRKGIAAEGGGWILWYETCDRAGSKTNTHQT